MKQYAVLPILFACLAGCGTGSEDSTIDPDKLAVAVQYLVPLSEIPMPCGKSGLTSNDSVSVSERFEIRTGPNNATPRLKNEKASQIFGETQYHVVDNSTELAVLCRDKDWSEVQIVEPDWLRDVRGWIPNKIVREIKTDAGGRRVFASEDFLWDKDSSPYKSEIVTAVNKISRENARCLKIDPTSMAKSGSKSKPGKPVFYVTCNTSGDAFNVWFEPGDVKHGRIFAATQNINQGAAVAICEQAAKNAATHPSTVEFSKFTDLSFHPSASGRSRVLSTFQAKNAFNLQLSYRISCLFDGGELIETLISEDT